MATQIRANILPPNNEQQQSFRTANVNDLNEQEEEAGNMDSSISSSSSLDNSKSVGKAKAKCKKPPVDEQDQEEPQESQLIDSIEQEKLRKALNIERRHHNGDGGDEDDEVESVMKAMANGPDDIDGGEVIEGLEEEDEDNDEDDDGGGHQSDDSIEEEHSLKYNSHAENGGAEKLEAPIDASLSVQTAAGTDEEDEDENAAPVPVDEKKMSSSTRSAPMSSSSMTKSNQHSPASAHDVDKFASKSSLSNAASTSSLTNQASQASPGSRPALAPSVATGLSMGEKMSPGLAKRVVAADTQQPTTTSQNLKNNASKPTDTASTATTNTSATSPSSASTSSNMSTNSSSSAASKSTTGSSSSSSSNVNLKIQSALERNMQRLNMNAPLKSSSSSSSANKANLSKEDIELFTNSNAEAQMAAVGGYLMTSDSLNATPEHQVYANYGFQTTSLMASPSMATKPGQNAAAAAAALRAGAVQPQLSPHQYQLHQQQQQQQQFNMNYFYPQAGQPLVGQQQQVAGAAASYYLNRMPAAMAGGGNPYMPAAQPFNPALTSSQMPIFNPSHLQHHQHHHHQLPPQLQQQAAVGQYPVNIGDREMTPDSIDNDLIFSSRPSQQAENSRRLSQKSSGTANTKTTKSAKHVAPAKNTNPAAASKAVNGAVKKAPVKQVPATTQSKTAVKSQQQPPQTKQQAPSKPVVVNKTAAKTVSSSANAVQKSQLTKAPTQQRPVQTNRNAQKQQVNTKKQPSRQQEAEEEEEQEAKDEEVANGHRDDDLIVHLGDEDNCFEGEDEDGELEDEEEEEEEEPEAEVNGYEFRAGKHVAPNAKNVQQPPLNSYSVKRYSNGKLTAVEPAKQNLPPQASKASKNKAANEPRKQQSLVDQTNRSAPVRSNSSNNKVKAGTVNNKSSPLVQVLRSTDNNTMPKLEEGLSNDELDGEEGEDYDDDQEAYEDEEEQDRNGDQYDEREYEDEEEEQGQDDQNDEEDEDDEEEQLDENSIQHSKDLVEYERKQAAQSQRQVRFGAKRQQPPPNAAGAPAPSSDFIFDRKQSTSSTHSNGSNSNGAKGKGGAGAVSKKTATAAAVNQHSRPTASHNKKQPIKSDNTEYDTDEETNKLLETVNTSVDERGRMMSAEDEEEEAGAAYGNQDEQDDPKQQNREMLHITHVMDPETEVLIEGVLFRARYLGSTQLVSDGNPTKLTRMLQAQEAVGRIKAPEGESQPSVEVDLFVSTEKIMVLNTDLQEIMMDHSLRSISYIADIGNLVVLMAKRKQITSDEASAAAKRQTKMICHVFESEEAQIVAQSIGQAFQVAYMEYLKANGIEDMSIMKDLDYQEVLNQQEIMGDELLMFARKECQKEVIVPKLKNEIMGLVIVESGWGSMLPTVVVANMQPSGPSARCGNLNIGDQIISVNGISMVGLSLAECQNQIKATKHMTLVRLVVVPCPPVVEVLIKRPDTKYQLGFSVQDGIICSLLRGGIAERGGVRVGHRIIEINNQSVVATTHDRIVSMLANSVGELRMKTMPTQMFRLLTGQDQPVYI